MGTNNIPTAEEGNIIPPSDHNSIREALDGNQVPRNNGVPEDEAGSLGTTGTRFTKAFLAEGVEIGPTGTDTRIAYDDGDIVFIINGEEKFRLQASESGANVPVGSVFAFAGPTTAIPDGYLRCTGEAISRTTYARLFSVIGSIHGPGDGTTTFNLPDYRGYFLRGVNEGGPNDPAAGDRIASEAGGNSGDAVGSRQLAQVGDHTHVPPLPGVGYAGLADGGAYSIEVGGAEENVNFYGVTGGTGPGGQQNTVLNKYVYYIIKV